MTGLHSGLPNQGRGLGKCWRGHRLSKRVVQACATCSEVARLHADERRLRREAVRLTLAASRAEFDARALAEAEEAVRKARAACERTRQAVQEGEALG